MKHSTQHQLPSKLKMLLVLICILTGSNSFGQVMYGDTIFWENFGTGTTRADISGRGLIGTSYRYEGPVKYVFAMSSTILDDYVSDNTGKGLDLDFVTDVPKFHEVPILESSTQYAHKPDASSSAIQTEYWKISAWNTMTIGTTIYTDYTTATYPANDLLTTANYPCGWVKISGVWKFGFYYVTYVNDSYTNIIPNDGYYALINDLDSFGGDYLKQDFHDHSGVAAADLGTSPYDPYTTYDPLATKTPTTVIPKARDGNNGRMLFVNCSRNSSISGAVYKRQVPELCRDAEFEFSVWVASVHYRDNNSSFRIEVWSADPGNDPSLGTITSAYEGQTVAIANNARLLHMGTTTNGILGQWLQIKEHFVLTGQDYCWVVVRNFGSGDGNDIVIDDLVFKPYAPFNLEVELSTQSINTACVDGLVTLLSYFPPADSVPGYISIPEYGFYFQGEKNGVWERVGSSIPIQTQSVTIPLELTLPLAEYNSYDRYRVIVATTPVGFGGKCITFTYPPVEKEPIVNAPNFTLTGNDVCDDSSGTQQGTFVIRNINQTNCGGWQVKVKMADGSVRTLIPQPSADGTAPCDIIP